MVISRKPPSLTGVLTVAELGNLYIENRHALHRFAFGLLKDSSLADDVVQDAFLKLTLAAPELESTDHALAYMHRTVKNLCVDVFRATGRRPNLLVIDADVSASDLPSSESLEPNHLISTLDDAAIVRQALSMLSPAERAALVMWEIDGRSTDEISLELGIKKSAVRHTVSRARASLRKVLSQLVIDEVNNLTALDLLTSSHKKAVQFAKKSSKIALSLILVMFAFLGFNVMSFNSEKLNPLPDEAITATGEIPSKPLVGSKTVTEVKASPRAISRKAPVSASLENLKGNALVFPGLDKYGIPIGFTVADSSGALGSAYFTEKSLVSTELELIAGQILKTDSNAANILISQSLRMDSIGFSYLPTVSFGQAGGWKPLAVRVSSMDIKRQLDGNYLVTAYIAVESEVETSIKIAASSNGRDLAATPKRVITRLVLDPSKTRVLAQAIYVVENGVEK